MFGKNASSYILKTAFLLVLMEEIIPFLSGNSIRGRFLQPLPQESSDAGHKFNQVTAVLATL